MDELVTCLESLDRDPSVGCIVLTGSAKAFAAGADISEMANMEYSEVFQGLEFPSPLAFFPSHCSWIDKLFAPLQRVRSMKKPIIAAVNGFALGGGCELAMMCDIILAGDKAQFGQPE